LSLTRIAYLYCMAIITVLVKVRKAAIQSSFLSSICKKPNKRTTLLGKNLFSSGLQLFLQSKHSPDREYCLTLISVKTIAPLGLRFKNKEGEYQRSSSLFERGELECPKSFFKCGFLCNFILNNRYYHLQCFSKKLRLLQPVYSIGLPRSQILMSFSFMNYEFVGTVVEDVVQV
jgi:hypothetical protein